MNFHRSSVSTNCQLVPAIRPFSCFDFVENHFKGLPSIHRCLSIARTHELKTILMENIVPEGIIADENSEIQERYSDYKMTGLQRVSLWSTVLSSPDDVSKMTDDNLIGYAILKRDTIPSNNVDEWHVFEAVLRKYSHHHNYAPHQKKYDLKICNKSFSANGTIYCQQNSLNKACAHVSLHTLLSGRPNVGILSYRKINELANKDKDAAYNPSKGLTVYQIRNVLEGLKISFRDIDYVESELTDADIRKTHPYQKYVYSGIESGMGALLGFRLTGPKVSLDDPPKHIIPFFGHTFNKDTWVPSANRSYFDVGGGVGYIPSESWTSSFIGHDDNFGSDFCVPRLYVQEDQADYVVELLNDGCEYSGIHAESISLLFLYSLFPLMINTGNVWMDRLSYCANPDRQEVVLRALYISKSKYLDVLKTDTDWNSNKEDEKVISILTKDMPESLWMIEISIPQLFPANERKLGEIILNAAINFDFDKPTDFKIFFLAR
ncbi:MAG: hypothetical protein WAX69_03405, partial [Victivallales bacterium]